MKLYLLMFRGGAILSDTTETNSLQHFRLQTIVYNLFLETSIKAAFVKNTILNRVQQNSFKRCFGVNEV